MAKDIRTMKNWVCWQSQPRDNGKIGKIPKDPKTGGPAKSNDPSTWATLEEAWQAKDEKGYDGVGFQLDNSGIVGIDIDHCIDENGKLNDMASSLVDSFNTYTEVSPSGHGLHLLIESPLELKSGRRDDSIGLEVYTKGRFLTITGDELGGKDRDIRTMSAQQVIETLSPYIALTDSNKSETKTHTASSSTSKPAAPMTEESNEKILAKAFGSKNGKEIQTLFDGDISAYDNDASRADLALVSHLAYWTNGNAEQMDRIFRTSDLMRDKWDSKRGSQTYGEMTINKALENFKAPSLSVESPAADEAEDTGAVAATESSADESFFQTPGDFINSGLFQQKVDEYKQYAQRKTGFSNMDEKMSLYPGLYAIGAISSLGKTTFASQLADQIAAAGTNVLFFTFEQSQFELVSKGLARENAKLMQQKEKDINKAPTAIQLRSGFTTAAVKLAQQNYIAAVKSEYIIDCTFDTGVDKIVSTLRNFMEQHDGEQPPFVVIDYLQVIAPSGGASTKENMDSIVRQLKQLQKETNVTILLISSFNRANYMASVGFESFKESGGIEYTVDALWGLQLACIDEDDIFNKENNLSEKRRIINKAKGATPRRIELVVLKDRYGTVNEKYFFNYYPNCDLYVPSQQREVVTL